MNLIRKFHEGAYRKLANVKIECTGISKKKKRAIFNIKTLNDSLINLIDITNRQRKSLGYKNFRYLFSIYKFKRKRKIFSVELGLSLEAIKEQ